jgi:hypothetical protein
VVVVASAAVVAACGQAAVSVEVAADFTAEVAVGAEKEGSLAREPIQS